MRSESLFLCPLLSGMLTACKGIKWVGVPTGTPPESSVTGRPGGTEESDDFDPVNEALINCSYIRGDLFGTNRILGASMGACNDLIYLTACPYANGDLTFDLPVNDTTLTGAAAYAASYNGRNKVFKLDGTDKMNAGDGLLHSPDRAFKKFTLGTCIHVSEWVNEACLFKKVDGGSVVIAFQLGTTEGNLRLTAGSVIAIVTNSALKPEAWHYVAITYDGDAAELYIDTDNIVTDFTGSLPTSVPNIRADFVMEEGLKGYLNETFVNSPLIGILRGNPISFGNWNNTKILAYWKRDDAAEPGKDSYTQAIRLEQIRTVLNGQVGDQEIRLDIADGEQLKTVSDITVRTNFANNMEKVIEQYNLGGADLDFE